MYCVARLYREEKSSMCPPIGKQECPLYPTELAFALDASEGVGKAFDNMRNTVLRLVEDITISESNCPRGARVALTLYNNEVTTEIRFADAIKKRALVQRIEGLQPLQTRKTRSLETAMSFVAQNTFKRVRSGFLMRKVAIFFVGGTVSQQSAQKVTNAALRLHDAGIATLFLVNRDDRTLRTALQVKQSKNKSNISISQCLSPEKAKITVYLLFSICLPLLVGQQHSTGPGNCPSQQWKCTVQFNHPKGDELPCLPR